MWLLSVIKHCLHVCPQHDGCTVILSDAQCTLVTRRGTTMSISHNATFIIVSVQCLQCRVHICRPDWGHLETGDQPLVYQLCSAVSVSIDLIPILDDVLNDQNYMLMQRSEIKLKKLQHIQFQFQPVNFILLDLYFSIEHKQSLQRS